MKCMLCFVLVIVSKVVEIHYEFIVLYVINCTGFHILPCVLNLSRVVPGNVCLGAQSSGAHTRRDRNVITLKQQKNWVELEKDFCNNREQEVSC